MAATGETGATGPLVPTSWPGYIQVNPYGKQEFWDGCEKKVDCFKQSGKKAWEADHRLHRRRHERGIFKIGESQPQDDDRGIEGSDQELAETVSGL